MQGDLFDKAAAPPMTLATASGKPPQTVAFWGSFVVESDRSRLMRRASLLAFAAFAAAPGLAAQAQPVPDPSASEPSPGGAGEPMEGEEEDIIVQGRALPGAVIGDIPPELQYSPADIRAFGVSNVSELLAELSPQTSSGRGRSDDGPVTLLNGRRIASFSELRNIPTEAIQRVDILPEEVALKYGYSANQKVVNIVLRRRFRATTVETEGTLSTQGGGGGGELEGGLLHLRGNDRLNIDVDYEENARLTERQRGIRSASTGQPFDLLGNIAALPGSASAEIDPALSAAVGVPVTIAGVPASAAGGAPSLAAFVPTANQPNTTDTSRYRTLRPATRQFSLNAVYAHPISEKFTATFNGTLTGGDSKSLLGLPGEMLALPADNPFSPFASDTALYRYVGTQPLHQEVNTLTGYLGGSLTGDIGKWHLLVSGNYNYSKVGTDTDIGIDVSPAQALLDAGDPSFNPFAPFSSGLLNGPYSARARASSNVGTFNAVANGTLAELPGGPISTSVRVGWAGNGFDSFSDRLGIVRDTDLSRRDTNGQLNIDLPITSRRRAFLPAIGNLSVNGNVAVNRLSDFGTLTTYGYGLNWSPITEVTLIASATHEDGAPSVQQVGNPVIVTPDVRVFDFQTGQTVDVTQVSGGNPNLLADNRHVWSLGLTVRPVASKDLSFTANYVNSRIRNSITSFPAPTAAIEAAFPERFVRDEDGNLVSIDVRPINFAREDHEQLRWGFNLSVPIKTSQKVVDAFRSAVQQGLIQLPNRPGGQGGTPGTGVPTGTQQGEAPAPGTAPASGGGPGAGAGGGRRFGGGPGGFGGGGFGRGGGGQTGGRIQVSFYHTWVFRDDILIQDGGPEIDRLHGGTTGGGGGTPQHMLDMRLGYSNNGLGARLDGQWQSGTTVTSAPGSATGDLRFSSLAKANLRLFGDLGAQPGLIGHSWARGARVTLAVNNIFNTRQRVRDENGATPLIYQPGYLDPLGRTVRIEFRKLFF